MTPSDPYRHRTLVQAAIRMKQLALDNQSRTIRRLRASNAESRKQVEDLTTLLKAAEKRGNDVFHIFELARVDNFDLRDTVEIAVGQAKRAKEEVDRRNLELAKVRQARVEDEKKLDESWNMIMQLSENNQMLTKEVDKGKVKKKALIEKHKVCCLNARSVLDEVVAEIQSHINEIAELKLENQNPLPN